MNINEIEGGKKVVISRGFYDPRPAYNARAVVVGAITLNCTEYTQEP